MQHHIDSIFNEMFDNIRYIRIASFGKYKKN